MRKYTYIILTVLFLANITLLAESRQFIHPGCSHKKSDLDRMKAMVQAGVEPWKSSFEILNKNPYSSYNYAVKWTLSDVTLVEPAANVVNNYEKFKYDALAAYLNSLMWYITGDERHAQKAVEIFNKMVNIKGIDSNGTKCLDAGRVIWKLLEGAEIIKSTYSGWNAVDIENFKAMLVYPGYSTTTVPTSAINNEKATFYWYMYNGDPGRHGNQGLFGMRGVMAMGIFMDNELMYERALRYLAGQPRRQDDVPHQSGPPIASTSINTASSNIYFNDYSLNGYSSSVPDYGYNEVITNYVYENGQCQESSRDQGHAIVGISIINSICEMAWNQGDDLYSTGNYRTLLGIEFYYRYNLSYNYSFADQLNPWEPSVESGEYISIKDRSQRWLAKKINPWIGNDLTKITRGQNVFGTKAPVYEMFLGHYKTRLGLPYEKIKWITRGDSISKEAVGYEDQGFQVDYAGFGGLTFHRANWMAGDPVRFENGIPIFEMPEIPCSINAVNYDFFTVDGQDRTFSDATPSNEGAVYRNDAVDIISGDNGYVVNKMQNGEWLSYTFKVPVDGEYHIALRHNTTGSGAKMKVVVDDELQVESALSVTSGFEETSIGAVQLTKGAKVIRIYVTGESNITSLSQIKIILNPNAVKKLNITSALNASNQAVINWSFENIIPTNLRIFRATSDNFNAAAAIKTLNNDVATYTDATVNGKISSYYYWVVYDEAGTQYKSDVATVSWGYFFDDFFNPSTALWSVVNGTGSISNNVLNINTYSSSKAYLSRTGGATLHAGNYPILAYKLSAPTGTSFAIHNAVSSILGGGGNVYSGVLNNNVYYYDLRNIGFVSSSITKMVPIDSILTNSLFQIRMTVSSSASSQLHWIGTFKSISELSQYIISDVKKLSDSDIAFAQQNNRLIFKSVNEPMQVRIYSVTGQLIAQHAITSSSSEIQLPPSGIYIVSLQGSTINTSKKIIVN